MESFTDGTHIRLRNREHGMYLHADEDGWGVSLSPHRASLNKAWAVHLLVVPHQEATYVLLHSAAYGRYLGVRHEPQAAQGHPVIFFRRMVQVLYNAPLQADVMWEVLGTEDGSGDVFLRLLQNQNPNQWSNCPWTVELIPARLAPPQLPDQISVSLRSRFRCLEVPTPVWCCAPVLAAPPSIDPSAREGCSNSCVDRAPLILVPSFLSYQ